MSEVPDGDPFAPIWQKRLMYYSANWQLLEEHIDDDFDDQAGFDANRHMQYIWGTRYIDDIVVRRQDTNLDDTLDKTWYHITDTLFSTVAILDDAAKLVERVSYDAYGNARHHRFGDLDGDGAASSADYTLLLANWEGYGTGDLNRDGTADLTDYLLLIGDYGAAQPAGRISVGSGGTDNIIGYAGYIFNAEMHGSGLYTVRYRHYSPELGRWLTRDPIGYVDGMSLYQYVASNPLVLTDPSGLYQRDCNSVSPVEISLSASMDVPPYVTAGGGLRLGGQVAECDICCRDGTRVSEKFYDLEGEAYVSIVGRSFGFERDIGRVKLSGFLGIRGEVRMYGSARGKLSTDRCNGRGLSGTVCGTLGISGTLQVGGQVSASSRWFSASIGGVGQAMIAGEMRMCLECDDHYDVWECNRKAKLCVHGDVSLRVSLFFFEWSGIVGRFEKCTAEQSF